MNVPENSFQDLLTRPARNEFAGKIRRLELRLSEVETLDPNSFDPAELHALGIAIRETLADAFTLGSFAYQQYSEAAEFGVQFDSALIDVGQVRECRKRSLALLRKAIQSRKEAFENKYPGVELPGSVAPHPSLADRAMAGAGRVGSGALGELTLDATAEVEDTPESTFNLLLARVAALEAALDAPKPQMDLPIGPGHNRPPEFDPPFEEEEIRKLIDLLKAQAPTSATDQPKLLHSAKIAQAYVSKLQTHIDEFTTSAVKGFGAEIGKRLAQIPWWLSVSSALNSVAHALVTWIGTLPH
ncbi:hypothetical protein [Nitrobacter sp.]|uniref:hypothetical protein n=1 Tax=Nitrobacter sp. TaxID=29420 RepID=UPI003F651738